MYGTTSLSFPSDNAAYPATHSGSICPNAKLRNTPPENALARLSTSLFSAKFVDFKGRYQHNTLIVVNANWKSIFHAVNGKRSATSDWLEGELVIVGLAAILANSESAVISPALKLLQVFLSSVGVAKANTLSFVFLWNCWELWNARCVIGGSEGVSQLPLPSCAVDEEGITLLPVVPSALGYCL